MADFDGDALIKTLQQIGQELDNLKIKTENISRLSSHSDHFTESVQKTTRSLVSMDTTVAGMAKNLLGPVGLAAGFYAAAKSLETFSLGQVQLRAFATNTGFGIKNIQDMEQGLRRLGLSSAEAHGVISTLGGKLQNVLAFKEGSELWESLTKSQGGSVLFNNIKSLVESHKQMDAVLLILKTFKDQTEEAKISLSQAFGVPKDVLQDLSEAMERGVDIWPIDPEKAKEYHNMWVDFEVSFKNIFDSISNHAIEAFSGMNRSLSESGLTSKTLSTWLNTGTDTIIKTLKTDIEDVKHIISIYESIRDKLKGKAPLHSAIDESVSKTMAERYGTESYDMTKGLDTSGYTDIDTLAERYGTESFDMKAALKKDSSSVLQDTSNVLRRMWEKGKNIIGRAEGGPVDAGKQYRVGERGKEMFAAGGQFKMVGEGGPEIIKPSLSGRIYNAVQSFGVNQLVSQLDYRGIPSFLKHDVEHGYPARTLARKVLGIDDPKEPAPWLPQGSWQNEKKYADAGSRQSSPDERARPEDETALFSDKSSSISGKIRPRNIEGFRSPYEKPTSDYKQIGWDDSRNIIDKSLGNDELGKSSLDAEISFKNVPPGVITKADGDGFDEFKVNKTKNLEEAR